jgi:hypothetical protein
MMHRDLTAVCLLGLLALLAAALPLAGSPVAASPSAASGAKKVCKTVTKKVHGKKRKVRVCTTVKPKPKPTPAPTPVPPDKKANQLVNALTAASDNTGRYTVLLQIMTAGKIGVSTPSGKALVPKVPMGPNDFYLYDFELHGLAAQLGGHQTLTLDNLTGFLTRGGITASSQALDNATVHTALKEWVQGAVSQPGKPTSLIALLVRDLGLKKAQPYDLGQDVPDASLSFDQMQELLIAAAIVTSPGGGSTTSQRLRLDVPAGHIRPQRAAQQPCFTRGPCGLNVPNPITSLQNWWNGMWLTSCVEVRPVVPRVTTDYGPPPGARGLGGKKVNFQVAVAAVCGAGGPPITSGPLQGATVPLPGPLAAAGGVGALRHDLGKPHSNRCQWDRHHAVHAQQRGSTGLRRGSLPIRI